MNLSKAKALFAPSLPALPGRIHFRKSLLARMSGHVCQGQNKASVLRLTAAGLIAAVGLSGCCTEQEKRDFKDTIDRDIEDNYARCENLRDYPDQYGPCIREANQERTRLRNLHKDFLIACKNSDSKAIERIIDKVPKVNATVIGAAGTVVNSRIVLGKTKTVQFSIVMNAQRTKQPQDFVAVGNIKYLPEAAGDAVLSNQGGGDWLVFQDSSNWLAIQDNTASPTSEDGSNWLALQNNSGSLAVQGGGDWLAAQGDNWLAVQGSSNLLTIATLAGDAGVNSSTFYDVVAGSTMTFSSDGLSATGQVSGSIALAPASANTTTKFLPTEATLSISVAGVSYTMTLDKACKYNAMYVDGNGQGALTCRMKLAPMGSNTPPVWLPEGAWMVLPVQRNATGTELRIETGGAPLGGLQVFPVLPNPIADFDRNAVVDDADAIAFQSAWAIGSLAADVDHDGVINAADYDLFVDRWSDWRQP